MIDLPDFKKKFVYENNFFLSSDPSRIGKLIAHFELFERVRKIQGDIVECGVFKGVSLIQFTTFSKMFDVRPRAIVGFDTFDRFPPTSFSKDKRKRKAFIHDAGERSISKEQLRLVLKKKGLQRGVTLVEGDIRKTVPAYVVSHPHCQIALLNLDTDIYEPAVTILEHLYPRIIKGGVLVLDDYGVFPGETKAVDDYFRGKGATIERFPYSKTPCYIVKR